MSEISYVYLYGKCTNLGNTAYTAYFFLSMVIIG